MRVLVILDSLFARPSLASKWGGKKREFRDWTNPWRAVDFPSDTFLAQSSLVMALIGPDTQAWFAVTWNTECIRVISTILVTLSGYSFLNLTGKNSETTR